MESESNGLRPPVDGERPALYALVIYLPDPLGVFLDDLRIELVPGCNPHSHVSVLPPRPLPVSAEIAIEEAQTVLSSFPPFEITLGGIEKFDATDVIYISVEEGTSQLREMHRSLNLGSLGFAEPFAYHPHITLAQEFDASQVEALLELASRRWNEYAGRHKFLAGSAVFVRNTQGKRWVDLATASLGAAPARRPE